MKANRNLHQRSSGVLLHPTSLPEPHGIGDLGDAAYRFVDFLAAAGCSWWQMLPIGPTGPGNCPYAAQSAFAGNPLLISLDRLADDGLLDKRDLKPARGLHADRVAYPAVTRFKMARLRQAFDNFVAAGGLERRDFERYWRTRGTWLHTHAFFTAFRELKRGQSWTKWRTGRARLRPPKRIDQARDRFEKAIEFEWFLQFTFDRQWADLRRYANEHGVGLIGDIPIFVAHESSDVCFNRDLFDLDAQGRAKTVSGVPPDIFSKTGQRWGHPQYRWTRHQATGFKWWVDRFARALEQFDAVRIDHFLGFHRVWSVPARNKTTIHGRWIKTPGRALFTTLRRRLGPLNIIAEDLGVVTKEAFKLREDFAFPGMRLLHFAFGNDAGDRYNQPHNYPRDCVVYPGTHDNDTTVGWWDKLQREHRRHRNKNTSTYARACRYLGTVSREIHWDIIRLALSSVANLAIFPAQDLLGLDNRARMNLPATTKGNWEWRLKERQLTPRIADRLFELNQAYQRTPPNGRD